MKNEIELFRVEIVRDRDTNKKRVRVWQLLEEHEDGGGTYEIVGETELKSKLEKILA